MGQDADCAACLSFLSVSPLLTHLHQRSFHSVLEPLRGTPGTSARKPAEEFNPLIIDGLGCIVHLHVDNESFRV